MGGLTMHAPRAGEVQGNVSYPIVFIVFIKQTPNAGAENGCDLVEALGDGHAVGVEGVRNQSLVRNWGIRSIKPLSDIYREKRRFVGERIANK